MKTMARSTPPTVVLFQGKHVRLVRRAGESYYGGSMTGTRWHPPSTQLQNAHGGDLYQSAIPAEERRALEVQGRLPKARADELVAAARAIDERWDLYVAEHKAREEAEQQHAAEQRRAADHERRVRDAAHTMRKLLAEIVAKNILRPFVEGSLYERVRDVLLETDAEPNPWPNP